jgi:hypothetical protein
MKLAIASCFASSPLSQVLLFKEELRPGVISPPDHVPDSRTTIAIQPPPPLIFSMDYLALLLPPPLTFSMDYLSPIEAHRRTFLWPVPDQTSESSPLMIPMMPPPRNALWSFL